MVRAEGERIPAAGDAQTSFRMAIVLLLAADEQPDEETIAGADEVRARFEEVWEGDTRGLAELDTSAGETEVEPLDPTAFTAPQVVPRGAW